MLVMTEWAGKHQPPTLKKREDFVMEKKMVYAICYKIKERKWYDSTDEYMARYGYTALEPNEELIEKLNAHDKDALKFCNITPEQLENIEYFFLHYQEDRLSED